MRHMHFYLHNKYRIYLTNPSCLYLRLQRSGQELTTSGYMVKTFYILTCIDFALTIVYVPHHFHVIAEIMGRNIRYFLNLTVIVVNQSVFILIFIRRSTNCCQRYRINLFSLVSSILCYLLLSAF